MGTSSKGGGHDAADITSPWSTLARRKAARGAKRIAVLRTAARFFNAKGVTATSLDDIAAALQVTKPTIYHYFSNKDEILFECVRLGLEDIRDAAQQLRLGDGTGRMRLEALMRGYALRMTRDFGICAARTSDDALSAESRDKVRTLKREIDTILRAVIEDGMQDGSIAKGDARMLGFTLAGAMNWIAHWYRPDGAATAEDISERIVATLLTGLAPR